MVEALSEARASFKISMAEQLGPGRLVRWGPMQQIAESIAEMRRIIERRGWCQGVLMNSSGQVCLLGARAVALGLISGGARPVEHLLAQDPTIQFLTARAHRSLPSLNDGALDHGVVMEFLIEAQLAAMNGRAPSAEVHRPSVVAGQEPPDDAVMALLV